MAIEYTPELRAKDADLARAMGWTGVHFNGHADRLAGVWYGLPPGQSLHAFPPRFHESEDARRSLLEWLAADDGRWLDFEKHLVCDNSMPKRGFEMARAMMLATPAQVAEAAHRAITEACVLAAQTMKNETGETI